MKCETSADNVCPQSMVTVIWTGRMQPVTCSYYQQKSYGLIICHLYSQSPGLLPAFVYTGQPCRCWVPPDIRQSHGALVFPGAGCKPHNTVFSVPGFPADYIPEAKEKINKLIKLKWRKKKGKHIGSTQLRRSGLNPPHLNDCVIFYNCCPAVLDLAQQPYSKCSMWLHCTAG